MPIYFGILLSLFKTECQNGYPSSGQSVIKCPIRRHSIGQNMIQCIKIDNT